MIYYYKKGNAYLRVKSPKGEGYTPITEEEFNKADKPKEPTEEQIRQLSEDQAEGKE